MKPEDIKQNMLGRQTGSDAADLLNAEVMKLTTDRARTAFWKEIQGVIPFKAKSKDDFPAMNDEESKVFGKRTIPFGKHIGSTMDSVPLSYLVWLVNEQALMRDVLRYIKSRRVQAEQEDVDASE